MNAKERARQQATAQVQAKHPIRKQLTTAEDLLKDYAVKPITTVLGNKYQIQKIHPGTYMLVTGSPLIAALSNIETDTETDDAAAILDELPVQSKSQYLQYMQRIVCAGVVSLHFTCDKWQSKCNDGELSIDVLPAEDLIELFNEIMTLSLPESEVETVTNFPETSAEEQPGDGSDSPDSEAIPPETE